jgi:hypothetical protein
MSDKANIYLQSIDDRIEWLRKNPTATKDNDAAISQLLAERALTVEIHQRLDAIAARLPRP